MNIKSTTIAALSISLLFITQTAHADFRKALNAYLARDGATMLKEVKDAVDKRNDDGLILFLNVLVIDYSSSKRLDRNIHTSTIKSTYEQILNDSQQKQMRRLLDIATSNSTAKSQWILLMYPNFSNRLRPDWWEWQKSAQIVEAIKTKDAESKFSEASNKWGTLYREELNKIASNGSADAAEKLYELTSSKGRDSGKSYSKESAIKWMTKSAEWGNPYMAISLGFKYLHWNSIFFYSNEGCDAPKDVEAICLPYDKEKGLYWLKQATKYFDKYPMHFGNFTYEMGNLELKGVGDVPSNPRQAYRWYLLGVNILTNAASEGQSEKTFTIELDKMKKTGLLKVASPELDAAWSDVKKRDDLLHPKDFTELPDWVVEARKNNALEMPVFSYVDKGRGNYALDVYKDGRVTLYFLWNGIRLVNKETYLKISSAKLKEFLKKLHQIGFDDWPLSRPAYGKEVICMDMTLFYCNSFDYLVTLNQAQFQRSVFMSQDSHSEPKDKQKMKNIAQIFSLVEKYFPTQKLRCDLSNSIAYKQDCVMQDQKIFNLAQ